MAREYSRKGHYGRSRQAPRLFIWVLAAFLSGYLAATVFDFTSLTAWLNKQLAANNHATSLQKEIVAKKADYPKPKFEFYTLLSKDNSAPIVRRSTQPSTPSVTTIPQPVNQVMTTAPMNGQNNPIKPIPQKLAQQATIPKVVTGKPVANFAAPLADKNSYLVQIAAFNRLQDAEHLKASLVLKGFDVRVSSYPQQKVTWYRVSVGPFASLTAAEKARINLARSERIRGMIRRMNA